MVRGIRLLIVEDSADDSELLLREFRRAGYTTEHLVVEDEGSFRQALSDSRWDAIICDYMIPGFGPIPALYVMDSLELDIPFIVVSGVISDAKAIEVMQSGAHDYVFKDNLSRLVPAVEREIRDAKQRARLRLAETELSEAEKRFSALADTMYDAMFLIKDGVIVNTNRAAQRLYGYTADEFIGLRPEGISPRLQYDGVESSFKARVKIEAALTGEPQRFEWRHMSKDGRTIDADVSLSSSARAARLVGVEHWHEQNEMIGNRGRTFANEVVVAFQAWEV